MSIRIYILDMIYYFKLYGLTTSDTLRLVAIYLHLYMFLNKLASKFMYITPNTQHNVWAKISSDDILNVYCIQTSLYA